MNEEQLTEQEKAGLIAVLTQRAARAENNLKQTLAPFRAALINGTFAELTPGTLRILTEYAHDLVNAVDTLNQALDTVNQQAEEKEEEEVIAAPVLAPEPQFSRVLKEAFMGLPAIAVTTTTL